MNIDRKRKLECIDAQCGFTKERCLKFLGRECIKLGGTRFPLQSSSVSESFPLSVPAQTSRMKPYFITDGWAIEDEEDDL